MEKAQIQFPRYFINKPKHEAIETMKSYVQQHYNEFVDGEEITIRYKAIDGSIRSVNAIVEFPREEGEGYRVSVEIGEADTLKIIESGGTEGIADKKSLWLSDNWDDEVASVYPARDLYGTVRAMAKELKEVREQLALCKEALTNTLGGGDVYINSTKYELENQYESEMPEDATSPYTTGDTEIYTWDIYIGPSVLSEFSQGGLYKEQRYYPKVRAFNSAGEEIEITTAITVTMFCGGGSASLSFTGGTLYAYTSGDTTLYATIADTEHGFSESKSYLIAFEKNERPSYQTYNVKHLLVKDCEGFDYMMEYADYILVGEFVWCIKEQALYLKEKAKNGTIQFFKINGQGSVTPTGETEEITYTITDDGTLYAYASEGSVYVDEDGVLNFIGTVDEDGTLILNNSEIGPGPTPTPTGDTSITVEVDRNGTLTIDSSDGSSGVDKNGNLIIVAQVDRDGNLIINNE